MSRYSSSGQTIVAEVSRCFRGTTLIFIGGKKCLHAKQEIEKAFELRELHWIETHEHQSHKTFVAPVFREHVKLVVLLTRWSSHSFGDIRRQCDRFGKCFLKLRSGYNVHRLAEEIRTKCGIKLGISI